MQCDGSHSQVCPCVYISYNAQQDCSENSRNELLYDVCVCVEEWGGVCVLEGLLCVHYICVGGGGGRLRVGGLCVYVCVGDQTL